MEMYYGLNRVLEPKGLSPATAWKLDNSYELQKKEARISLERIHLEWDNFQQICNSCSFDETKIKAKIFDIIEKRGKLHNPFTGSGGVLIGRVDEIADVNPHHNIGLGDRIYCITSLSCVPIHIEEIKSIDYHYGQIECTGYAILFEASPVYKMDENLGPKYTLAAVDEAGSLFGVYHITAVNENKKIIIMGRNLFTTMIYAAAVRQAKCSDQQVMAIMDVHAQDHFSAVEIRKVLEPLVDDVCFVDLTEPILGYEQMKKSHKDFLVADQVVVAEDIFGTETLAVQLVRPLGDIYFTAVENHYAEAQMVAESMGKVVSMFAFDQYTKDYPEFTIKVVKEIQPKLEAIDRLYEESKKKKNRLDKSRKKSLQISKAGKEDDFIYQSQVTRSMVEDIMNIAKYDCNVIIQGETGVGKERVLSLIHQNSDRHGHPCIKINCATIAESLAESEFFGYEAGAFTGAQASGKPGYFEMANNGILFLDEIGTLSMNMQSKLLRVLQENQFYRVGGTKQISVNVRVIVANNVPLKELVDQGKFREDLYYRLNICKIDVPPLRERRDDILCLAESFTHNWTKKYKIDKELSPDALYRLYDYYWPGNVRELENIIHRLVISSRGIVITGEDVEDILNETAYGDMIVSVKKNFNRGEPLDYHQLMEQQEKQIIEYALKKEGTTRKAAELIGLPQTTFARKKLKYGL